MRSQYSWIGTCTTFMSCSLILETGTTATGDASIGSVFKEGDKAVCGNYSSVSNQQQLFCVLAYWLLLFLRTDSGLLNINRFRANWTNWALLWFTYNNDIRTYWRSLPRLFLHQPRKSSFITLIMSLTLSLYDSRHWIRDLEPFTQLTPHPSLTLLKLHLPHTSPTCSWKYVKLKSTK